MRPFSASSRSNKFRIIYGVTALKNIRKSFDKYKFEKERELYHRLQHKIDVEYKKSKTNIDFRNKDRKLNIAIEVAKQNKKLIIMNNKIKNIEKFRAHSNLYQKECEKREEKINNYKKNYIKKEKKCDKIRANELNKRFPRDKGYPKDFIIQRLIDVEQKRLLKHKMLETELSIKEKKIKLSRDKKAKHYETKKIELENNLKLRNQRINHILTEQNKQREEIWKKIEKRNKDIDRLLFEKEKINEQKRNISDYYTNKYEIYSDKIDNILYKKDFDNNVIKQIHMMSSTDHALAGLGQNLK